MTISKVIQSLLIVSLALIIGNQAWAQSDQGLDARVFGQGQPQSVDELPPGQLKNKLKSLPPQARARALRWLQDFSFPAADAQFLDADSEGNIFYADTFVVEEAAEASSSEAGPEAAPATTLDDAFLLHSRPGASKRVFVDFDGHVITGTAWNNSGATSYAALPYDLDGDPSTFNATERERIVSIWHRISEDMAPFDIDVTTEEPLSFDRYTGRILVTHTVDGNGNSMPSSGGGGVAYVGVFGNSNYHTYYSPALVYYNHLGGGSESSVAEASSHELGHNLALSHDGQNPSTSYYQGHGSGLVSWAPIMGVGYYKNVTQWSKGEYTNANQLQDDLAIIDGRLGYADDDHGDTLATASTLEVIGGNVVSSNPEFDPHNLLPENKGIIGHRDDIDVFSFVTGAGNINLSITPAWDAFYNGTSNRGANLDIEAELRNISGALVTSSDPTNDTSATINASVTAGSYYLLISGVGNDTVPYSDYGSLGYYFINGTVPSASEDNTAPTPDPMQFASAPAAISYDAISMTAVTATDDVTSVQYNFRCIAGGSGCSNSGWQSATSYTATGLAASTQYTFTVEARDTSANFNTTAASGPQSATTNAPPPPPAAPSGLAANGASETSIDLTWNDNASTETGFRVERSAAGAGNYSLIASPGVNASSYTDTGREASTSYDYRVAAVNDFGVSAYTNATGTTDDPPPYVNYTSTSDTPVDGSVSGAHTDTHSDNGSAQSITERQSGGKPSNRHAYLEHRWNFNINPGATVTVFVQAWKTGSNGSESFDFDYSANGGSYQTMLNVSSGNSGNLQSFEIPGAPSGSITIRVKDTYQVQGNTDFSTIHVDHLYIQVGNPPSNPPDGNPGNMTANAVSSSQINLAWSDGSSNEAGFKLERSADGSTGWSEIADLAANSTNYNDMGLTASTAYYYRVSAYNANGSSGFASANATTQAPPPAPDAPDNLVANAISTSQINLSWTDGGPNEDNYRVERSPGGANNWATVTTLAANATGYNDGGLDDDTTYDYRVIAVNGSGEATSEVASATTDPLPSLSLSASGYKDKGKHHVVVEWTGGSNVDVYRDGQKVASNQSAPSYDDNIGAKGGATYQHKVCLVNDATTCSNTTTTVF